MYIVLMNWSLPEFLCFWFSISLWMLHPPASHFAFFIFLSVCPSIVLFNTCLFFFQYSHSLCLKPEHFFLAFHYFYGLFLLILIHVVVAVLALWHSWALNYLFPVIFYWLFPVILYPVLQISLSLCFSDLIFPLFAHSFLSQFFLQVSFILFIASFFLYILHFLGHSLQIFFI